MNIEKKHRLILLDAKLRMIHKHERNAGMADREMHLPRKQDDSGSIPDASPSFGGDAA